MSWQFADEVNEPLYYIVGWSLDGVAVL